MAVGSRIGNAFIDDRVDHERVTEKEPVQVPRGAVQEVEDECAHDLGQDCGPSEWEYLFEAKQEGQVWTED
jgi:hypothetical protein